MVKIRTKTLVAVVPQDVEEEPATVATSDIDGDADLVEGRERTGHTIVGRGWNRGVGFLEGD